MRVFIVSVLLALVAAQTTTSMTLQTMKVAVNQTLLIQKGGNPATAYDWIVSFDQPSIASASVSYVPADNSPLATGLPYLYTITILGVKAGSTVVTLKYKRPWEITSLITEQYNIVVEAPTTKVTFPQTTTTTLPPQTTITPTTTKQLTTAYPSTAKPTTTASPTTTTTPVRTCWTCPAGLVHWYDIGLPEPADKCACVTKPTTTAAPTTTTVAPTTTTTSAPTTTTTAPTTTTAAPTTTTTTASTTTTTETPSTTTTVAPTPEPTSTTSAPTETSTVAPTQAPATSTDTPISTLQDTTTSSPTATIPVVRHIELNQIFAFVKTLQIDQVGPDLSWTVTVSDPSVANVIICDSSPSVSTFTITGVRAGSTEIIFEYRSITGEAQAEVLASDRITVIVDPAPTTNAPTTVATAEPVSTADPASTTEPVSTSSLSTAATASGTLPTMESTSIAVASSSAPVQPTSSTEAPRNSASSNRGISLLAVATLSILLLQ